MLDTDWLSGCDHVLIIFQGSSFTKTAMTVKRNNIVNPLDK